MLLTMIPAQDGVSLTSKDGLMAAIRKASTVTETPKASCTKASSNGKRHPQHLGGASSSSSAPLAAGPWLCCFCLPMAAAAAAWSLPGCSLPCSVPHPRSACGGGGEEGGSALPYFFLWKRCGGVTQRAPFPASAAPSFSRGETSLSFLLLPALLLVLEARRRRRHKYGRHLA